LAVQALAAALGPASGNGAFELLEAAPKEVEPALDRSLDRNAATRAGGTTLLMLAQPDVERPNCCSIGEPISKPARSRSIPL
jgi:hypothetical protein